MNHHLALLVFPFPRFLFYYVCSSLYSLVLCKKVSLWGNLFYIPSLSLQDVPFLPQRSLCWIVRANDFWVFVRAASETVSWLKRTSQGFQVWCQADGEGALDGCWAHHHPLQCASLLVFFLLFCFCLKTWLPSLRLAQKLLWSPTKHAVGPWRERAGYPWWTRLWLNLGWIPLVLLFSCSSLSSPSCPLILFTMAIIRAQQEVIITNPGTAGSHLLSFFFY